MEENGRSLSSTTKGNSWMIKDHTDDDVLKSSSSSTNKGIIIMNGRQQEISFGDQFSWPPKSYACNFCKREFRSAQALGGHMNVHRREKAKLRQINPQKFLSFLRPQSQIFLHLNNHQNPNPNLTTSFSSNLNTTTSIPTISIPPFKYTCCLPLSDPCSFHRLCRSNRAKFEAFGSWKSDLVVEREGHVVVNRTGSSLVEPNTFEDLDLELRLGCS